MIKREQRMREGIVVLFRISLVVGIILELLSFMQIYKGSGVILKKEGW